MQTTNDSPHDPLDEMLGAIGPAGGDADPLRAAVLGRTLGLMRRRHRWKRGIVVGGLAACYLAGIATMVGWQARGPGEPPAAATRTSADQTPRHPQPPSRPTPKSDVSGGSQLAAATPTPFEGWRNIGNYYLQQSGDISTAVASYSQALDLATAEERAISPGQDNWLMMALKDARAKEQRHAPN